MFLGALSHCSLPLGRSLPEEASSSLLESSMLSTHRSVGTERGAMLLGEEPPHPFIPGALRGLWAMQHLPDPFAPRSEVRGAGGAGALGGDRDWSFIPSNETRMLQQSPQCQLCMPVTTVPSQCNHQKLQSLWDS